MKTHVLSLLMVSLCSFAAVQACPVVHIANIRVIDQHGKGITNAKIYRFYGANDSLRIGHYSNIFIDPENQSETIDSSTFELYSSGGYYYANSEEKPITKMFLIQAPGFADVSIKSIRFQRENRKGWQNVPVLEVVMYAKKLVRTGNEFMVYGSYFLQEDVKVVDSLRIELKDYLKDIRANQEHVAREEMSQVSAKAYPNPVVDELHIQFSFTPQAPHTIMLHDAQGKLVYETSTENTEHEILMNWYSPGTYFLTIYDPVNAPLLRQQIIKR